MTQKALWTWGIAIVMLAALAGPAHAQPAGTLVVGLVAEPVNLDPAQVTDLNSNRVGRRVVESLVTFPEEKTEVVPGLAESWTISKDGLQYTLNYAVNKDAIVKDVLKGTGTPSRGPVMPNTWGAEPALKAYPYDPARAKKLLAEAAVLALNLVGDAVRDLLDPRTS